MDVIAYTRGPGMRNCLGVSAASAKALAAAYRKPVIGIHHMVSPLLKSTGSQDLQCSITPSLNVIASTCPYPTTDRERPANIPVLGLVSLGRSYSTSPRFWTGSILDHSRHIRHEDRARSLLLISTIVNER